MSRAVDGLPSVDGTALGADPLAVLTRAAAIGPLVRLKGKPTVVVVSSPAAAHSLLIRDETELVKTEAYRKATRFLGKNLGWAEGAEHRGRRRAMSPAFNAAAVDGYAETMAELARARIARWTEGRSLDLAEEMLRLNLGVVARTLFGAPDEREIERLVPAVKSLDALVHGRLVASSKLAAWWPSAVNLEGWAALRTVDAALSRIGHEADRRSLLAMLRGDKAVELEAVGSSARDEAVGLLVACQDTTPYALTWALYSLARHRPALAAVQEELDEVLSGRPISPRDGPRLTRLADTFRETLRLYPPVFMTMRRAAKDIAVRDVDIPAGARVLLNIYGIHRDAACYEQPAEFRPERWRGGLESSLPRGAFIPFIEGPRRCLGSTYARTEAQMVLATVLQAVSLELVDDAAVPPLGYVTLRPARPIRAIVRPRVAGSGR